MIRQEESFRDIDDNSSDLQPSTEKSDEDDELLTDGVSSVIANEKFYCNVGFLSLIAFSLLFYIGTMGSYFLLPQYLLFHLKNEANISDSNYTGSCYINETDPQHNDEQKIQEESSRLLGYNTLAAGIPCILTVFFYGAVSDRYGRKLVIMVNFIGLFLSNLMLSFVINFNLNFFIYVACTAVTGFSGSYSSILAAVFAYTADVTTTSQRNVAIGFMEGCLGLAAVITSLFVGFWISAQGYGPPMIGLTGVTGMSALFLLLVKETRVSHMSTEIPEGKSVCSTTLEAIRLQLQDMKHLLAADKKRTTCLLLLISAFFCHSFVYIGLIGITTLYLMNEPLCWVPAEIGVFTALKTTAWMIGGFLIIVIFRKKVKDVTLIMVSLVSFIFTCVLFAVSSAVNDDVAFILVNIGTVIGAAVTVCPALIRSVGSKLVGTDEQGAVFGLIATGEALAIAIGPTFLSMVYSSTVAIWKGFVFFVSAGIIFIGLVLILIFRYVSLRRNGYSELSRIMN